MLAGTLTLGANQAPQFLIPFDLPTTAGHHVAGRYAGSWQQTLSPLNSKTLFLPHRDKEIVVTWDETSDEVGNQVYAVMSELSELDAAYAGSTQLEKYRKLISRHAGLSAAFVLNTKGNHGAFSLLSFGGTPLGLLGVYDQTMGSAHLLWSTRLGANELVRACRAHYPLKYLFYRFPQVVNGALFLPVQATCAHWHKYLKAHDPLFAFNALELKLFR